MSGKTDETLREGLQSKDPSILLLDVFFVSEIVKPSIVGKL